MLPRQYSLSWVPGYCKRPVRWQLTLDPELASSFMLLLHDLVTPAVQSFTFSQNCSILKRSGHKDKVVGRYKCRDMKMCKRRKQIIFDAGCICMVDRAILHLRKQTADTFERAKVKEKFSYRHSISREFVQLSRISVFWVTIPFVRKSQFHGVLPPKTRRTTHRRPSRKWPWTICDGRN